MQTEQAREMSQDQRLLTGQKASTQLYSLNRETEKQIDRTDEIIKHPKAISVIAPDISGSLDLSSVYLLYRGINAKMNRLLVRIAVDFTALSLCIAPRGAPILIEIPLILIQDIDIIDDYARIKLSSTNIFIESYSNEFIVAFEGLLRVQSISSNALVHVQRNLFQYLWGHQQSLINNLPAGTTIVLQNVVNKRNTQSTSNIIKYNLTKRKTHNCIQLNSLDDSLSAIQSENKSDILDLSNIISIYNSNSLTTNSSENIVISPEFKNALNKDFLQKTDTSNDNRTTLSISIIEDKTCEYMSNNRNSIENMCNIEQNPEINSNDIQQFDFINEKLKQDSSKTECESDSSVINSFSNMKNSNNIESIEVINDNIYIPDKNLLSMPYGEKYQDGVSEYFSLSKYGRRDISNNISQVTSVETDLNTISENSIKSSYDNVGLCNIFTSNNIHKDSKDKRVNNSETTEIKNLQKLKYSNNNSDISKVDTEPTDNHSFWLWFSRNAIYNIFKKANPNVSSNIVPVIEKNVTKADNTEYVIKYPPQIYNLYEANKNYDINILNTKSNIYQHQITMTDIISESYIESDIYGHKNFGKKVSLDDISENDTFIYSKMNKETIPRTNSLSSVKMIDIDCENPYQNKNSYSLKKDLIKNTYNTNIENKSLLSKSDTLSESLLSPSVTNKTLNSNNVQSRLTDIYQINSDNKSSSLSEGEFANKGLLNKNNTNISKNLTNKKSGSNLIDNEISTNFESNSMELQEENFEAIDQRAVLEMALDTKQGLLYARRHGRFGPEPVQDSKIGIWLFTMSKKRALNPTKLGMFFAKKDTHSIFCEFVNRFEFTAIPIVKALKLFFEFFKPVGEGAIIDRTLEQFSKVYVKQNQNQSVIGNIKDWEMLHSLTFAILMLNTELHYNRSRPLQDQRTRITKDNVLQLDKPKGIAKKIHIEEDQSSILTWADGSPVSILNSNNIGFNLKSIKKTVYFCENKINQTNLNVVKSPYDKRSCYHSDIIRSVDSLKDFNKNIENNILEYYSDNIDDFSNYEFEKQYKNSTFKNSLALYTLPDYQQKQEKKTIYSDNIGISGLENINNFDMKTKSLNKLRIKSRRKLNSHVLNSNPNSETDSSSKYLEYIIQKSKYLNDLIALLTEKTDNLKFRTCNVGKAKQVNKKMTSDEFVKNTRRIVPEDSVSSKMLKEIYEDVNSTEIMIEPSQTLNFRDLPVQPLIEGWLTIFIGDYIEHTKETALSICDNLETSCAGFSLPSEMLSKKISEQSERIRRFNVMCQNKRQQQWPLDSREILLLPRKIINENMKKNLILPRSNSVISIEPKNRKLSINRVSQSARTRYNSCQSNKKKYNSHSTDPFNDEQEKQFFADQEYTDKSSIKIKSNLLDDQNLINKKDSYINLDKVQVRDIYLSDRKKIKKSEHLNQHIQLDNNFNTTKSSKKIINKTTKNNVLNEFKNTSILENLFGHRSSKNIEDKSSLRENINKIYFADYNTKVLSNKVDNCLETEDSVKLNTHSMSISKKPNNNSDSNTENIEKKNLSYKEGVNTPNENISKAVTSDCNIKETNLRDVTIQDKLSEMRKNSIKKRNSFSYSSNEDLNNIDLHKYSKTSQLNNETQNNRECSNNMKYKNIHKNKSFKNARKYFSRYGPLRSHSISHSDTYFHRFWAVLALKKLYLFLDHDELTPWLVVDVEEPQIDHGVIDFGFPLPLIYEETGFSSLCEIDPESNRVSEFICKESLELEPNIRLFKTDLTRKFVSSRVTDDCKSILNPATWLASRKLLITAESSTLLQKWKALLQYG